MSQNQQQLADQVVQHMLQHDRFSEWLGVELLELRTGFCKLRMKIREEMINGFGVCHGGIAFSFADSALAFASNSYGNISVALDLSISYPKSLILGDVITATAVELSQTRRTGLYDIQIHNQNAELCAAFRGTVYRTEKKFFPESSE